MCKKKYEMKRDNKNKKHKKHKLMRLLAGALALALAAAASAEPFPASAAQRETAAEYTPETAVGGVLDFVTEPVESVNAAGSGAGIRSVTEALQQYEWDCYSSDYYYSKLSAKEQLLYERLDAACGELLSPASADAASYEVTSGGATVTRRGTEMVSTLGLTDDQVKRVQMIFVYANPQYYFINTILLTKSDSTCALGVYDAFASGADRAAATKKVFAGLASWQSQISADGTVYETDSQIHDLICAKLTYMEGDEWLSDYTDPYYTQSIYGAVTTGSTVCAGYAKLYALLCNYFGIDCIAVTSDSHAWNQVRYGDCWFVADLTWDDSTGGTRYAHLTAQQMLAEDQNGAHEEKSFYDGILPDADAAFSQSLTTLQGLAQPQAQVTDTAAGVTITLEADDGDIYYTLDGTAPDASDLYQKPIELTSGGTYVVTALTMRAGALSSAYEIFTVRVAGGSASVSFATNVSGKKIKVQFKSTKTYAGYEISYASKKDFSNQKSAKVTSKSVTISGLKKGTTYYIRVRGYKKDAYGNYYYTSYSKTKKVTVTK